MDNKNIFSMRISILALVICLASLGLYAVAAQAPGQAFVHPGMMQNSKDLELMREKVLSADPVWKKAFDMLKADADLNFKPLAFTHISVGPYGANSKGGREFSQSARMAYYHSLMWSITKEKAYAEKAIEILNAWSARLWDFDDNNAKLDVGLGGPYFLNAAEILKYSGSGWQQRDIQRFRQMVLGSFYPTVRSFFTEANGNWDASMINTLLCIGVFTDNREIFDSAVQRYFRGEGNSGITKYIYPNGQIQETTRDWDHVQLGIGEFAKAAQVAWTQGVDFYSSASDRLALGFEYTSRFMLGDASIPVYGLLSLRSKEKFRDIYENIYDHYRYVRGIELPYTFKVITSQTRKISAVGVLTGIRYHSAIPPSVAELKTISKITPVTTLVGASELSSGSVPSNSVFLSPGDSIQPVLDRLAGTGRWVVLKKGVHELKSTLEIPSGTTICGEGKQTILFLSAQVRGKTIINRSPGMSNVTIRDMLIEGAISTVTNTDPNADRRIRSYMNAPSREGILFSSDSTAKMDNIRLISLTVQNFTKNGVSIRGAKNILIDRCNLSDNGSSVVPGNGFHHNLHLTRSRNARITNNRLDSSPWGSGADISFSEDIVFQGNEAARNRLSGLTLSDNRKADVSGNLLEGNDVYGIHLQKLADANQQIKIQGNVMDYNAQKGLSGTEGLLGTDTNTYIANGRYGQSPAKKLNGNKDQ